MQDYIELTFTAKQPEIAFGILVAELSDLGFDTFTEENGGLQAYVPKENFEAEKVKTLLDGMGEFALSYTEKEIPGQNWNAEWESNFSPVIINDKALIRAEFHEEDSTRPYNFLIAPKMAFGTGHHQTTLLISRELFQTELADKSVLDMGCGTGILAIIAKKLGARMVDAIDIEQPSVENTLENMGLNDLSASDIKVELGDASLLGSTSYQLVLANINRNVLTADMATYAQVMEPQAEILLSGFFEQDIEIICEAGKKSNLSFVKSETLDGWAMVKLRKG